MAKRGELGTLKTTREQSEMGKLCINKYRPSGRDWTIIIYYKTIIVGNFKTTAAIFMHAAADHRALVDA